MSYFLQSLLICTITMSCVTALLLALSPFLQTRYRAKTVYIAWIIVLIGFVIPFRPQLAPAAITVPVGQMNKVNVFSNQPKKQEGQALPQKMEQGTQPISAEMVVLTDEVQADTYVGDGEALATPTETISSPLVISLPLFITIVWAAGAMIALCYRLLLHHRFMKTVKRWRRPVTNPAYLQLFTVSLDRLGIKKKIKLMKCMPIDTPMLIGLIHPCILLPDEDMPLSALHLVLKHELTHYKHGDLFGKILMLVASAMYWFNPLMPMIASAMSFQCEAACDAEVTRGTDLDVRMYYSETILQMVRKRSNMSTALSTCYRGTKKTMRKRIMGIMNEKRKKLGILIVTGIFVAVLCAGMTLALGATFSRELEQELVTAQINEYSWWGDYQYYEDMGNAQGKLAALIDKYHAEVEATKPALLDAFINNGTMPTRDLTDIHEALDTCKNADDLLAFLASDNVAVIEDHDGIDRYITEVLHAAGHSDMPYRAYRKYEPNLQMFPEGTPEGVYVWTVYASGDIDPETGKRPVAYLYALEGYRVSVLATFSLRYEPSLREMTEAEKQFAKERVLSFSDTYVLLLTAPADTVLVSDRVFEDVLPEPYTYVWRSTVPIEKNNENAREMFESREHDNSFRGLQIVVGLETGTIYDVSQHIPLVTFVNATHAEKDWQALTGLEYPYFYNGNLYETVCPWIEKKVSDINSLYQKELSLQEQVTLESMQNVRDGLNADIAEWKQLVLDLDACTSAAEFKRILNRGYVGIDKVIPDDTQSRKESQAKTDAIVKGFGYEDYQYGAKRYDRIDQDQYQYGFYYTNKQNATLRDCYYLIYRYDNELSYASDWSVNIAHGYHASDIEDNTIDFVLTAEQIDFAKERALAITDNVLGVGHMQDEPIDVYEKAFKVSIMDIFDVNAGEMIGRTVELFAHVWVPVRIANDSDLTAPGFALGYEIDVGLDTGRIYSVSFGANEPVDPFIIY